MKILQRFFFLLAFSACQSSEAQSPVRVETDAQNPLMGYYMKSVPSGEIQQVLLLLPGYTQRPESIYPETKLPEVAVENGILTIAVAGGPSLYANEFTRHYIRLAIDSVLEEYPETANLSWVMGGFSAGGMISLRYVEFCAEDPENCPVKFSGVFTVDSPVDLYEIWNYFERELDRNFSEAGMQEARFVMDRMLEQEGHPYENTARYDYLTPFKVSADAPGNEARLMEVAVRVYHDIDIGWLLENRQRSAYEANFLQSSEMIARLIRAGHESAEFIQSEIPGVRSSGLRHPHSWSIVDVPAFIEWMQQLQ